MTFPLTLIFMFLVFWRPQEWLLPWLYGWPLLDAITYAALLALIMETNQGQVRFPKTPVTMLAVALWVSTILSHMAHTYFQGIVDTIPESFKFCFFLILLMVVIDRVGRVRAVIALLVLCAVVITIHCLMQERIGHGFGGGLPLHVFKEKTGQWQTRTQFFGIFSDPNDTAQFLSATIPLVFAIPKRFNPISLMTTVAIAGLLLMGVLSTHSRGGMVALAASLGALVFLILPARWLPYAGVLGLIMGLVLCGLRGGGMLDMSAQERVVFWGMANRAFKSNPIFGLGYGMFWQVTTQGRAAHNAFVSCYTELGLVGYWCWFGLLQLGVLGCWRTRMALARPRTMAQAYLRRVAGLSIASLVGFAAGGYFLSRAFIFPFFFLFGLLNAIPVIAQRMLPEDHPPLIDTRRDVMISGTLATLLSVAYVYVTILILNKVFYG